MHMHTCMHAYMKYRDADTDTNHILIQIIYIYIYIYICNMQYAICTMHYAICNIQYKFKYIYTHVYACIRSHTHTFFDMFSFPRYTFWDSRVGKLEQDLAKEISIRMPNGDKSSLPKSGSSGNVDVEAFAAVLALCLNLALWNRMVDRFLENRSRSLGIFKLCPRIENHHGWPEPQIWCSFGSDIPGSDMPPCRCLCRHISALCWLGFWSWYGCLDAQKSSKQAFLCHPVWNLMQFFFKRYDVDSLPKLETRRFCFGNFGKFPKVFAAHALFPFRQCVGWGPGIASQQALRHYRLDNEPIVNPLKGWDPLQDSPESKVLRSRLSTTTLLVNWNNGMWLRPKSWNR